jgi:hypothetical protein
LFSLFLLLSPFFCIPLVYNIYRHTRTEGKSGLALSRKCPSSNNIISVNLRPEDLIHSWAEPFLRSSSSWVTQSTLSSWKHMQWHTISRANIPKKESRIPD